MIFKSHSFSEIQCWSENTSHSTLVISWWKITYRHGALGFSVLPYWIKYIPRLSCVSWGDYCAYSFNWNMNRNKSKNWKGLYDIQNK
jgi:hypothetical protein